MTENTAHPHFDDRGTLHWERTFAGAKARAAADNRLVFVELGRKL